MKTMEMVTEFHHYFGLAICGHAGDTALRDLRSDLIREEADEAIEALFDGSISEVAKELADLVYVAYGAALSLGIDLDEALSRVHMSNMSKLGPDGKPLFRGDGKVLKGPSYREPNMTGVAHESD